MNARSYRSKPRDRSAKHERPAPVLPVLVLAVLLVGGFGTLPAPAPARTAPAPASVVGSQGASPLPAGPPLPPGLPAQNTTTLSLVDGLSYPGNYAPSQVVKPGGVAYDSRNGCLYVLGSQSSPNVEVVNASTGQIVALSIPVGGSPAAIAYDARNGALYVTNTATNNVTVINGSTDRVSVAGIGVGYSPIGVAVDPVNDEIFVANNVRDNLTVISGATNTVVVPSIGAPTSPSWLTFDPSNDYVYVTSDVDHNMSAINASTNRVAVPSIGLGGSGTTPSGLTFDAANGDLYVAIHGLSNNVSVINASTNAVVVPSIATGSEPSAPAYDPVSGDIYTANQGSANVTVISGATNRVLPIAPAAGSGPIAVAYASSTGRLYVVNTVSDNLTVVDGATNAVVPPGVTVGLSPSSVVYAAVSGEFFVSETNLGRVYVVNATRSTVVTSVKVGVDPDQLAYDSRDGLVYVVNAGSSNLTSISATSNRVHAASIPLSANGSGIAYDPVNDELYVSESTLGAVVALNASNGQVAVPKIGVGGYSPTGLVYAPSRNEIYVDNYGARNVSAIYAATNKIIVGGINLPFLSMELGYDNAASYLYGVSAQSGSNYVVAINVSAGYASTQIATGSAPGQVVVDDGEGLVFVTDTGTNEVTLINSSTAGLLGSLPVGLSPVGLGVDPSSGAVEVANSAGGSLTQLVPATTLTVSESTLPAGLRWWFNVTGLGSYTTNTTSLTFAVSPGIYLYQLASASPRYAAFPARGSVAVHGGPQQMVAPFQPVAYLLTFTESGLPSASGWWADVAGSPPVYSNGTTASLLLANGSYSYRILSSSPGWFPIDPSGTANVSGAPVGETISFERRAYTVEFEESGAFSGNWSVALGNATISGPSGQPIEFAGVANGSYAYRITVPAGFTVSPAQGSLTVAGPPASPAVTVTVSAFTYLVTFVQTGLPAGYQWGITALGESESTLGPSLEFELPNGTIPYALLPVAGFSARWNSSVVVAGRSTEVTVLFAPFTWTTTFSETGLPAGANWSVTVNGSAASSVRSTIDFLLPNGSSPYAVARLNLSGVLYLANPRAGTVEVDGVSSVISVRFEALLPPTFAVTFTESGLPAGTAWSVNLSGTLDQSNSSRIVFEEPNGSQTYTVAAAGSFAPYRAGGTIEVLARPVVLGVTFGRGYTVTFDAQGLPPGGAAASSSAPTGPSSWGISLLGATFSGPAGEITVLVPNGSYPFAVLGPSDVVAISSAGVVTVDGAAARVAVLFTPVASAYRVTWTETGLPVSANWTVTVNGFTVEGSGAVLSLNLSNGTFSFTIGADDGYRSSPTSGTVRVAGSDLEQPVAFSPKPSNPSTGTQGDGPLLGAVAAVTIAAGLSMAFLWRKRTSTGGRRGPPPAPRASSAREPGTPAASDASASEEEFETYGRGPPTG